MGQHCGHDIGFDGTDHRFRTALTLVIAINFTMFIIEVAAGQISGSQALMADALDFFADSVTYTISLLVIGKSLHIRSRAALIKGYSLLLMGMGVMGSTLYDVFYHTMPKAEVMGIIGIMALAANISSVLILMRWRNGDANIRSVWLCSRNDAIGNIAVMLAALGVAGTGTAWPDILVASLMAALFTNSAIKIIRQSHQELSLPGNNNQATNPPHCHH